MNMYVSLKKIIISVIIFLFGLVGCNSNKEITIDSTYLLCNQTSNGKMAEVGDGYFFVFNQFLYYADKDNLENWVAVCNKPECSHEATSCNAALATSTAIWQNDNKLYEVTLNTTDRYLYVYEMAMDGNGAKNVYEIPTEGVPSGHGKATFQDQFIIRYNYLDEKGFLQERIICLEEDKNGKAHIDTLYKDEVSNASLVMSGNEWWGIRGENLIVTTLQLEEGGVASNNLCKIDDGKIEPLNLPDEIPLLYGYFKDNVFTYYKQQEGFYQYNINTSENNLLLKNQLEDGEGFILSENYLVECNKDYLKIFMEDKWNDVKIPEEVLKFNGDFYPVAIASDRIFFRMNVKNSDSAVVTGVYLYYMMLNEENPQFIFAGKIGEEFMEEETSINEIEDDVFANFEEVTVCDEEDYLIKVTDVYLDYENRFCIDFYFENKSSEKEYSINLERCVINGIQCNTAFAFKKGTGKNTLCFDNERVNKSRVSEFYSPNEYTDIEIDFWIYDGRQKDISKIFHIYPQGEEKAIHFERDEKDSDNVLLDNEYVSVIITGYEENFVPNDTINVLIKNKSEQSLCIKVEESSANGIAVIPNVYYGTYWTIINPGAISLYPMTLFDDEEQGGPEGPNRPEPISTFFDKHNITRIEEIEMRLKILEFNHVNFGDVLVDEIFVLNP